MVHNLVLSEHFGPDILRFFAVVLSGVTVGSISVLFRHVGRVFRPKFAWRVGYLGVVILCIEPAIEALYRLGGPVNWRTIIGIFGLVLMCMSSVTIDRWFHKKDGRELHAIIVKYFEG